VISKFETVSRSMCKFVVVFILHGVSTQTSSHTPAGMYSDIYTVHYVT